MRSSPDKSSPSAFQAPVLSVAPMMGYTDRHLRYLLRQLSPNSWLYTEMVTSGALIHADPARRLAHHSCEEPLVLQLGGGDPGELAKAAAIGVDHGYRHINLNAGCPSDKVQNASIGACLLKDPLRLRACARALRVAGVASVSVKTRIGVDEQDSYERCLDLAAGLHSDGCDFLALHARKAWLSGLSPSQNRSVPPLDYDRVFDLQRDLPQLPIIINGGLANGEDCRTALEKCAGVMLGRSIISQPRLLMDIEQQLWGTAPKTMTDIFERYFGYLDSDACCGDVRQSLRALRHLMSLIKGAPGAAAVRRQLSQTRDLGKCARICLDFAASAP